MSVTKNILGKFATGEFLCWLDADNFIKTGFTDFLFKSFDYDKNIVLNVEWSPETTGMCGRVSCSKHNFMKINGYDETMKGWGYEDLDFVNRLQKVGIFKKEIPLKYMDCIVHSNEIRFENYNKKFVTKLTQSHSHFEMRYESNYRNFRISQQNIKENKIKANVNKDWGILEL